MGCYKTMKLSEVSELYKIYMVKMSNGDKYKITGMEKAALISMDTQFAELKSGSTINKSFVVNIDLDTDATRENVQKNAETIKNLIVKA